jgi:DNA-binding LytR/AlgR family response regulator
MHQITKRKSISTGVYIFWIAAEIFSLAIIYLILQRSFIEKSGDIFTSFQETVKITSLVLLLPYTLTFLYFSWMDKNRKIEELSGISLAPKVAVMIPFRDEKGELRFSVKSSDLLYLEAADNYVSIYYLDRDKKAEYLIRNSLKNLEEQLKKNKIIRCHRSFMVNVEKVKIVRREKDGLVLELDTVEKLSLPISQSYVREVMQLFLKYPVE